MYYIFLFKVLSFYISSQPTMEEGQGFSLCGKAAVTEANLSKLKTF